MFHTYLLLCLLIILAYFAFMIMKGDDLDFAKVIRLFMNTYNINHFAFLFIYISQKSDLQIHHIRLRLIVGQSIKLLKINIFFATF